jgi:glyoxylase-like metal-dependent hydrolase (beta-lactamase superfamily II)
MKTSEWVMSFVNLGFIKDGGQTAINPTRIAPGVILLGGVSNNSMVVRRASGVVVVEGALHDLRAEAVIRFIHRRFPGARITHVITTHHHSDHSGGMRPYVALGARAVLHRAAAPFFRKVFRERNSTIMPDRLDRTNRPARIVPVPANGSRVLNDADQTIEVLPFPGDHAVDMTVTFVQQAGVLFVSDVYSPPGPPGDGGAALNDLIVANNLNVDWIAGGHGSVIAYDDFVAQLP